MKIAYLITAYKDEKQLARLIKALMCEDTDFYVHIDRKVNDQPFKQEVMHFLQVNANRVHFVKEKNRIRVCWGGYSQVKAQLALIREMIQTGINYNWCLNLTGAD
ncbi:MAG: hypothetical protein MSH15_01525, partial [Oscillospiraceae bacterium]|nr:hypothetical protein [Oscillospiraceae bacterium]